MGGVEGERGDGTGSLTGDCSILKDCMTGDLIFTPLYWPIQFGYKIPNKRPLIKKNNFESHNGTLLI